jgi:hypothetical protein
MASDQFLFGESLQTPWVSFVEAWVKHWSQLTRKTLFFYEKEKISRSHCNNWPLQNTDAINMSSIRAVLNFGGKIQTSRFGFAEEGEKNLFGTSFE